MRQNLLPCSLALLIGAGATFWSEGETVPRAGGVSGAPELRTVVIDLDAVFDSFPRLSELEGELKQKRTEFEAEFDATVETTIARLKDLRDEMDLVKRGSDRWRLLGMQMSGMNEFVANAGRLKEQSVRERVAAARNDRLLEVQEDIERGLQVFTEQSARNGEPIGMILRRRRARDDDPTPTKLTQRDYGDVLFADARLDVTARVIQFFQSWGPAQPKKK